MHELWSHLVFGPTIFKTITDIILAPFSPSSDTVERAIQRVQMDLDHLRLWTELLQSYKLTSEDELAKGSGQIIPWRILEGSYTLCVMIKRRLLTSLAPRRFLDVEVQCQALADTVVRTSAKSIFSNNDRLCSGLYTAQTLWIAKSIVQTKDMWSATAADSFHEGVIEQWKFEAWCNAFGRKIS